MLKCLYFYTKRLCQWGFVNLYYTNGRFTLPIQCSTDIAIVTAGMDNVATNNAMPIGRSDASTTYVDFLMEVFSEISVICICKSR